MLYWSLVVEDASELTARILADPVKKKNLWKRVLTFLVNPFYYGFFSRLHWWPLDWLPRSSQGDLRPGDQIAYRLWHFPVLSQTFVHREMEALTKNGLCLSIFADAPEDPALADQKARKLLPDASYLLPIKRKDLIRSIGYFLFRKPFRLINSLLFLITHRYCHSKSIERDWIVFTKALRLADLLREKNIRHIHATWADESAVAALLASRLLNTGFSFQARAHEIHRRFHQFAFLETLPHADFLITNTQYNKSHIESLEKSFNRKKIILIHNGVDLEELQPSPKTAAAGRINILCVARLIEQKGLVYLLKACRKLIDRGYEFRCEIIGGPEPELYMDYYISLQELYQELALSNAVVFSGALSFEIVREKYCQADIFVLPSVIADDGARDIIPNSLLEAMAMKLPVISTRVTGIPEIVEDGISGLLVPPRDEEALMVAIIRLINNPDLRISLGENARRRIEEKFDIEKNIKMYCELFGLPANETAPSKASTRLRVQGSERRDAEDAHKRRRFHVTS